MLKKDLKEKEHTEKLKENFISSYRKELEGTNQETIKEYKNYIKSTKINIFFFCIFWDLPFILLESPPKFIFPEEKSVLVPYNKNTIKINCSIICAKGKKDNIVSTPDKWYPIVYTTFVAKVKDLIVTKTPFGEIEDNNKKN